MVPLTLYGRDAITVSLATNRQCEVLLPSQDWRTASGEQEAMRYFRDNPQYVRLVGSPRVLLEVILDTGIDPADDLQSITLTNPADDQQKAAFDIIKEHMQ